jgi:hypothetical protein
VDVEPARAEARACVDEVPASAADRRFHHVEDAHGEVGRRRALSEPRAGVRVRHA